MAKPRGDGAIRVGTLTDWKKSDNPNAPRTVSLQGPRGKERIKIWPEKTTGWNNKKPIKGTNEALAALAPLASGESAGTVTALIHGYEQDEGEYGIVFYAEGEPTIPAPADAIPRYILEAGASKATSNGSSGGSSPILEVLAAIQTAAFLRAHKVELDDDLLGKAELILDAGKAVLKDTPANGASANGSEQETVSAAQAADW